MTMAAPADPPTASISPLYKAKGERAKDTEVKEQEERKQRKDKEEDPVGRKGEDLEMILEEDEDEVEVHDDEARGGREEPHDVRKEARRGREKPQADRDEDREGDTASIGHEIRDFEVRGQRIARKPLLPTKAEIESHYPLHLEYRSWCKHCVSGKGRSNPHRNADDGRFWYHLARRLCIHEWG